MVDDDPMRIGDATAGGRREASGLPVRVLVVDDEPTIRIALRRFFTRLGWTVEEASNGDIALDMLLASGRSPEAPAYQLVISDLRMPGLSGIELHERLKAARPEILSRLIFSTGDIASQEVALFLKSTECLVLQKPFELASLLEQLRRILGDDDVAARAS